MQGRKRYRKLIAMSQLVVASNNPALSCPLRAQVTHDLRNLLATVGLHLETLQRLSGPSGAKAANAANALLTRGVALCNDALDRTAGADSRARPQDPSRRRHRPGLGTGLVGENDAVAGDGAPIG